MKILILLLFPCIAFGQTQRIDSVDFVYPNGTHLKYTINSYIYPGTTSDAMNMRRTDGKKSSMSFSDLVASITSIQKRTETYSGTTNGSGVYTVVFPVVFSVSPNIQASISAQSTTNQYLRISAISTTGFTVNAYAFNTNSLLGIVSLVSTTSAIGSLPIDVLISEK